MYSKTVGDINRCLCMIVNLFTDVYHSDQFRNYGGTNVSGDFNKTIEMKSSIFYSMMTVQRFEQQADEITVIAPFYTVIINQNSDFFLEGIISISSFIQNYYCLIYNDISNRQ